VLLPFALMVAWPNASPAAAKNTASNTLDCVPKMPPSFDLKPPLVSLSCHYRQQQNGRMFGIMQHRIRCGDHCAADVASDVFHFPGVRVAIEAWKIAAGNFQPDYVPFLEHVAGGPQVDLELVDLAGRQQRWSFLGIAKARAQDAFGEISRESVRVDIDEFGGEVGVCG